MFDSPKENQMILRKVIDQADNVYAQMSILQEGLHVQMQRRAEPATASACAVLDGWVRRLLKDVGTIKSRLVEIEEGKLPVATVPNEPVHVAASAPSSVPRLATLSANENYTKVKLAPSVALTSRGIESTLRHLGARKGIHYLSREEPLDPMQPNGPKTKVYILPAETAELSAMKPYNDCITEMSYQLTSADIASMEAAGKSGVSAAR